MKTQTGMKKLGVLLLIPFMAMNIACTSASAANAGTAASAKEPPAETTVQNNTAETDANTAAVNTSVQTDEYFTDRDMEQTADLTDAKTVTVKDNQDISITEAGVYVLKGSAKEVTVTVDAADDAKVQIVLDGVTITNTDSPCIYVKNADKVFVTTTSGSDNKLSVTGTFTADGDTNTDAVIFSKDDVTLSGLGTLTVKSTDNGITSKDDLKVTGGTYVITAANKGLEANDSIRIADGKLTIDATDDGLHAEDDDDDTTGFIYIAGGDITVTCQDDAIHATTTLVVDGGTLNLTAKEGLEATDITINDGDITINASDDGINAGQKSDSCAVQITINGGTIRITMNGFDTDAIDSNGALTVNGGTIDITGQSAFDYDGKATYNGGTIIVNGETVNTITNQMMGGMGMQGGHGAWGQMNGGEMPAEGEFPQDGQMPQMGEMPSEGMQGGHHGGMRPGMNGNMNGTQQNGNTQQGTTENSTTQNSTTGSDTTQNF